MQNGQPAPRYPHPTPTPIAAVIRKFPAAEGPGRGKSLADLGRKPLRRVAVFPSPKKQPRIYYAPRRFTLDRKEE